MWECRCSQASVSAVTCMGEGNNLRSHVSLGFSCSRSNLSNGVLVAGGSGDAGPEGSTEVSSHLVWPDNLLQSLLPSSDRNHAPKWNFGKVFSCPFVEQTAWERMSSVSPGLFSYWLVCLLGGWRWLSLSHWEDWSLFPLLEDCVLPSFPSLQTDLRFEGTFSAMNPALWWFWSSARRNHNFILPSEDCLYRLLSNHFDHFGSSFFQ